MKKITITLIFSVLFTFIFSNIIIGQDNISILTGPYLGQEPPDLNPEVFAPGIISHGFHEFGIVFSPDGKEIFYVTSNNKYTLYTIITLKLKNNIWSAPEVAPFSGHHTDNSLCFSPDGKRLFFRSKRPVPNNMKKDNKGNFWVVERIGGTWSEPVVLGNPINTENNELSLSVSENGSIYFAKKLNNNDAGNIYLSRWKNGKYTIPKKLSNRINTEYGENRPYISPDETILLFQSNRPGTYGQNDIYVSFKQNNSTWGEPVNLGVNINSASSEFAPYLTPDGKYLFFSSYKPLNPYDFKEKSYHELLELYRSPQNGYATLYWVNAKILKKLKPQE